MNCPCPLWQGQDFLNVSQIITYRLKSLVHHENENNLLIPGEIM